MKLFSSSKPQLQQVARRGVLKKISGVLYAAVAGFSVLSPSIRAAGEQRSDTALTLKALPLSGPLRSLIVALRATGSTVCLRQADRLEAVVFEDTTAQAFDLHLRSANLSPSDAKILAKGMLSLSVQPAVLLRSFSVSYNATLGQAGIVALIDAMPLTLTELGMVGCDMTDASADALLQWAARSTGLRVICVEENRLSNVVKKQFVALRETNKELLVVV